MTRRSAIRSLELPLFILAAVMFAFALLTSCATLKGAGGAAVQGPIDCGKPALQDAVADIAPTVNTILSGGSVNWQEELDEYKAKGLEVLACAVAKVGIALASGSSKPVMASAVQTPADRASIYLQRRGLNPVNVQR